MVFGPCGGALPDGRCELPLGACVFPDVVAPVGIVTGAPLARVPRATGDRIRLMNVLS